MTGLEDLRTERLIGAAVVVLLTVTLTAVVVAIPAAISFFLPYGSFSYGEALALLGIGAGVLPVFVVALLLGRTLPSEGRTAGGETAGREP